MNKELAFGRFKTFEKRFIKDKDYSQKYHDIMANQYLENMIEKTEVDDKRL